MKKYLPLFMIIGLGLIFTSNRFGRAAVSGQPATGAPGETGQTCASVGCHFQGTFEPEVSITLLDEDGNSTDMYLSGKDYTVVLNMSAAGAAGYGFQMVSLKDSDNTGVDGFKDLPDFVQEAPVLERQYVEQNDIITQEEVVLGWTAPASNSGSVTFYAAVNAVDESMSPAGDGAIAITQTFQEDPASSTFDISNLQIELYPNPAIDRLVIGNLDGIQKATILDMSGKELLSSYDSEINIQSLNSGLYIVRVTNSEGQVETKKFVKK